MATGGVDRLSELPNDVLRRILHFAPLKEAASTTALSRRWRAPLWLSSGAVNLEAGVVVVIKKPRGRRQRHEAPASSPGARFFSGSGDFVPAAMGALDAAVVPVTRLTLTTCRYSTSDKDEVTSCYKDFVKVVLSHRAARRVEELRLVAKDPKGNTYDRRVFWQESPNLQQLETLRILELTNFSGLLDHRETKFPRLSSLRLSNCSLKLESLQRVIDAAPALAVIRLETVCIEHKEAIEDDQAVRKANLHHLRCPATTILVLDSCTWPLERWCPGGWYYQQSIDRLEINATRLCRFSYKGSLRWYSFSPRPLELEQVDLEFFKEGYWVEGPYFETFWRFTRNFTSTKEIRLKVNHLEDITVLSEARQVQLLPAFRHLERLECHGAYWTKDKTAPLATIMNLLHCCPALSALRINLTPKYEEVSDKEKDKEDVRKPRTTRKEILAAAMVGPRYLFQCLQSSLRRVDLQFQLEKKDCFGVKLMKIFAENAMVLEEMRIDSGVENLCEHMSRRIEKWNSSRKELGATSFVLLPLKR